MHNPDFALTILENAYAFATLYNEKYLTIDYLIKGIEAIDFISETLKQDFINKIKNYDNKILSRTRVQNKVLSLNNLKKPNN